MEGITIYPKNKKQKLLLKSLLEGMKIPFVIVESVDKSKMSKSKYIAKIEKSIKQSELGQRKEIFKNQQKIFLDLKK
jgi:hypothetical protein